MMGNRAVITTPEKRLGLYLHWNGGRDSVEGFLLYCKMKEHTELTVDSTYGFARLAQVVGNFFGGSISVGVGTVDMLDCDNGNNGTYIVEGWAIVGREHFDGLEQDVYPLLDMLLAIDAKQPENEQLGEERIRDMLKEVPR